MAISSSIAFPYRNDEVGDEEVQNEGYDRRNDQSLEKSVSIAP